MYYRSTAVVWPLIHPREVRLYRHAVRVRRTKESARLSQARSAQVDGGLSFERNVSGLCSLHLHAHQSLTPPLDSLGTTAGLYCLYRYGCCCCCKLMQLLVACSLITRLYCNPCPFRCCSISPPSSELQTAVRLSISWVLSIPLPAPKLGLHALIARPFGRSFA